ncbi:MAG: hypothetical protein M9894_29065 [Planctomycetes bacterium]|nr:hypothetical protein [Planctomycetota bacterium]
MDEQVRALERRWRATGAMADEARYLEAQARASALDERALRLAAHLRHPAARVALGLAAPEEVTLDLEPWFGQLAVYGSMALLRGAVAGAWLDVSDRPSGMAAQALAALVEPWLLRPDEGGRSRVRRFVESELMGRVASEPARWLLRQIAAHGPKVPPGFEDRDARKLRSLGRGLSLRLPLEPCPAPEAYPADLPPPTPGTRFTTDQRARLDAWSARVEAQRAAARAHALWAAVRDDLIPWALGRGDPIAARQAARA